MKYFLTCIVFLFFVPFFVWAAPEIKGKIVDKNTAQPVESANIILSKKGETAAFAYAVSKAGGVFGFAKIAAGEYSLTVKLLGYDVYENQQIVVTSETLDLGTIELEPLEIGLSEVVVVAEKRQVVYKLDKKIIDASSSLMSSGGTAVDILENSPSIRVSAEGDVTFRGSSGFKVYIDGKPSLFSGTQALQQVPAGHIENIEIITTPSARHDTDGEVGIINIVTKKNTLQGFSGMLNAHGSTALSNGLDFLLIQKARKLQWHLAGYWNMPVRESRFEQNKITEVNSEITNSHSVGPRSSTNFFYGLRSGLDYRIFENTSLNAELELSYKRSTRKGDLNYSESRTKADGSSDNNEYSSRDEYDLPATVNLGKVGFEHKFNDKEHRLTGNFMLAYVDDAVEYFQSDLFDNQNQRRQGHRAWEDEIRWTVRGNLDYVRPFSLFGSTGKFESGYQYHSYLEDGDYSMQFWNPETQLFYWRDDIYNTFYFQRGVNSVYAIVAESFEPFEIQAGLRGEHTHQVLRSSIAGANRTVNRFELFPSIHAGYALPANQQLTAAYSYRTNRPELFFMEPYITYRDYYTAEIGNPDIRPEYIHSYELNYKKNQGEHVFATSLFYRYRRDKIERLRVPYTAGVTLDSMSNVGHDRSTGLELNCQLKMTRWWNLNLNGNIYYYKVENQYKTETSANYDFTLNNLIQLGKTTRIQLDGNFVGPSVTTQGRSDSFWFVNLAVRQQLFNRNLQSTLSFRDIFNSARYRSNINTAQLKSITAIRPNYPVITLSISYTFNNYKKQAEVSRDNRDLFEGTRF